MHIVEMTLNSGVSRKQICHQQTLGRRTFRADKTKLIIRRRISTLITRLPNQWQGKRLG